MTGWNLGDLFEAVVDAAGEREALVAAEGRFSYEALDRRVNQTARVLADRGIGAGDHVGLMLRNGSGYLELMLAAFKLRAVPVNLNYRYTVDELRYLVDDSGVALVVHEADLGDCVDAAVQSSGRRPITLSRPAYEQARADASCRRPEVRDRSGDDRYVLYTGGTTGMPKGVVWRHEDLYVAALSAGPPLRSGRVGPAELASRARTAGRTRCLPASPFTHGTAHWAALATLLAGDTVVVSPPGALEAEALWRLVERERVSLLVIVGDAFARPLADALDSSPGRWDLSHLLSVVSGGAALSPVVRQTLLTHLPWAVVVDGYGTSETGGQGRMAVWPGQPDGGRPRFDVDPDTAVLDDRLRPVTRGSDQVGRLARRGHIPLGYHNDPERTARTFPVVDGERWAIPGDLATLGADGRVTLLGRGSSSINSGGEKVFPEEVEATLKTHPEVSDAVVVGVDDARWGQRVAAVVQLRSGSQTAAGVLVEHCRDRLAGFKAPRQVVFVDHLVRSASGKPDYRWATDTITADCIAADTSTADRA